MEALIFSDGDQRFRGIGKGGVQMAIFQSSGIFFSLGIILLAGVLAARAVRCLRLPDVTGYLLAGVLIGPWVLHLVSEDMIDQMGFVTDIALAFIAFGAGRYFRLSRLRARRGAVVIITLFESLAAGALIFLVLHLLFGYSAAFSLLLGAIGCATAPASTLMTIRQYKAKGAFVDTLLQVVALDDAVALIAFSICAACLEAADNAHGIQADIVLLPVLYNFIGILLGILFGVVLQLIADRGSSSEQRRLLSVLILLLLLTGVCDRMQISPLLSCMVMGAAYINCGGSKKTFKCATRFTPPVLTLFFVLSGMRLSLPALKAAGLAGVIYFLVRIAGKYFGAWLGCTLTGSPKSVSRWLGLALIPQAGVSIGLAALGQRMLSGNYGELLNVIILSSGVLYEMVGPACAKASLFLSGTLHKEAVLHKGPPVQKKGVERQI